MKIKIPAAALAPEKYRVIAIDGRVGQQVTLYHQLLCKQAKASGADVPLSYVVKEMLREACKGDVDRECVKPRLEPVKLKSIEVEGDVAQAIHEYMAKLGLEEPDYVIESLLASFLKGDRSFQQSLKEAEEKTATPATKERAESRQPEPAAAGAMK